MISTPAKYCNYQDKMVLTYHIKDTYQSVAQNRESRNGPMYGHCFLTQVQREFIEEREVFGKTVLEQLNIEY